MRSRSVVSSLDHGSCVLESTFLPKSHSKPRTACGHGRSYSPILPPLLHITPKLSINCPQVVTAEDAEPGGWIRSFSRVVHFEVNRRGLVPGPGALVPFHGLSPVVKSLRVHYPAVPSSQIFHLILSFPVLVDLSVFIDYRREIDHGDGSEGVSTAVQPSSPPAFTGSLELAVGGSMAPIAFRLLSLPGCLYLRKLTLTWNHVEDPCTAMALVKECSDTLESLSITSNICCTSVRHRCPHQ